MATNAFRHNIPLTTKGHKSQTNTHRTVASNIGGGGGDATELASCPTYGAQTFEVAAGFFF
jgi:hypothetical protein